MSDIFDRILEKRKTEEKTDVFSRLNQELSPLVKEYIKTHVPTEKDIRRAVNDAVARIPPPPVIEKVVEKIIQKENVVNPLEGELKEARAKIEALEKKFAEDIRKLKKEVQEKEQPIIIQGGGGGGNALPNYNGKDGKYLTVAGNKLAWGTVASSSSEGQAVIAPSVEVRSGTNNNGSWIGTIPEVSLQASNGLEAANFTPYELNFDPDGGGVITGVTELDFADGTYLTSARINKRVVAVADGTSITPNVDTTDIVTQANTQVAGTLTMNAPTGTPVAGQSLLVQLKSTNVQTFSWNAIYRGSTAGALPTASSGSSLTDYYCFIYNSTDSKWDFTGSNSGF